MQWTGFFRLNLLGLLALLAAIPLAPALAAAASDGHPLIAACADDVLDEDGACPCDGVDPTLPASPFAAAAPAAPMRPDVTPAPERECGSLALGRARGPPAG